MRKWSNLIFISLVVVVLFFTIIKIYAVEPNGATIEYGSSQALFVGNSSNISAVAGNITELEIFSGFTVSQTWQGFYGTVTGGLRLSDGANNMLYNWSLVTPSGEIYASTNSTITWGNIQCFNFSAVGNYSNETGNGGTTNLYGTNLTIINQMFNMNSSDFDSINNTFDVFNHDPFFTANQEFSANECRSIQLFTNESESEDGVFEEVLLYEPVTTSIVFMSILEDNKEGFNGSQVDFEMIVLEDGHDSDTESTPYFFYLELE